MFIKWTIHIEMVPFRPFRPITRRANYVNGDIITMWTIRIDLNAIIIIIICHPLFSVHELCTALMNNAMYMV